jgi:hypothetical protein
MLERSVASSDRLSTTHALTYFLERTVICLDIWSVAQALLNFVISFSRPSANGIVRNMLGRAIAASTVIAGILLIVLLQTTSPSTVGPLGLLAVFFLLYVIMLGAITELLWVGSRAFQAVGRRFTSKRPPGRLSLSRSYYFSTVLALGPVMALAMQSIGSFGVYEMVLIGAFLAVGTLYVSRRSSR